MSTEKKRAPWESDRPKRNQNIYPDIKVKESWLILTQSDIDWIKKFGHFKIMEKESILIFPEKDLQFISIILNGDARVHTVNGFKTTLDTGCLAGELSFLSGERPMANVILSPSTSVLSIPIDLLRKKCKDDIDFSVRWNSIMTAFVVFRLQSHLGSLKDYSPSEKIQIDFANFIKQLSQS